MAETHVRLTQCKVVSEGTIRIDQIGAGVGVILFTSKPRTGAGLHILAPHSGGKAASNPVMYADTAIPHVLKALKAQNANPPFSVAIAGGSVMMGKESAMSVGPKVVEAVKNVLSGQGLQVKLEKVGGTRVRSIILDVDAGKIKING
jgi:chemotaxis receptor (MCP) glutamine deamidase CheD